jgi:hypothetical protein
MELAGDRSFRALLTSRLILFTVSWIRVLLQFKSTRRVSIEQVSFNGIASLPDNLDSPRLRSAAARSYGAFNAITSTCHPSDGEIEYWLW